MADSDLHTQKTFDQGTFMKPTQLGILDFFYNLGEKLVKGGEAIGSKTAYSAPPKDKKERALIWLNELTNGNSPSVTIKQEQEYMELLKDIVPKKQLNTAMENARIIRELKTGSPNR